MEFGGEKERMWGIRMRLVEKKIRRHGKRFGSDERKVE